MINKKHILAALVIVFMTFTSVNASSLVQMDVDKTTDNEVNVTFHATETSSVPIVTKKSDNKYVILMPNVSGHNSAKPNLSAINDIITDVDIKSIDDGIGGYTKITFITTKPLQFKTNMKKAAPITQEEKAAKEIIAQIKTHPKQTTQKIETVSKPAEPVSQAKVKPNVVVDKSMPVTKKATNKVVSKSAVSIPKKVEPVVVFNEEEQTIQDVAPVAESELVNESFDIKEVEKIEKISKSFENKAKNNFNFIWLLMFLPFLGVYLLAKMAKNSLKKSNILKASFKENLAAQPVTQGTYEDIINASELNWQEKYQKFLKESKGEIKRRKYAFITTKNSSDDIEQKRIELEETYSKSADNYESENIEIYETEPVADVVSEDSFIQKNINTVKLRSFAKPASLSTSNRNQIKKALPVAHKFTEGKFVNLKNTPLNVTSRRLRNSNLSVSDLMHTSGQYIKDANKEIEIMEKEQNYIMSSIDEYFALLDKEQSRRVSNPNKNLSNKVAASLAQVKPSMYYQKPVQPRHITNPIEQKKENNMNGLIVKAGYDIDDNKGFYIVNLDGVNALIGRIGEEIFVLKRFDTNVDRLQVRLDNENVYMVKAGDFKSLIDVSDTKMGVLIEL